jgi:hypothetical protein
MKAAQILESGLAGAATLTLLSDTLGKLNHGSSAKKAFHKKGIIRHLKKSADKKGFKAVKIYVRTASELLGMIGSLGLTGLNRKKYAPLRGAILGALAGAAVAFLQNNEVTEAGISREVWKKRVTTIAMYTVAGIIASKAARLVNKKDKKHKK